MTLSEISQVSGITIQRLFAYEMCEAPVHWADAMLLASALRTRLSVIINVLKQPSLALSDTDHKAVIEFAASLEARNRAALRIDVDSDIWIAKLHQGMTNEIHDASIADWPAFLPPSLSEHLLAEAVGLDRLRSMIDSAAHHKGAPIPIKLSNHIRTGAPVHIRCGMLLARIHFNLQEHSMRLRWLSARHALHEPSQRISRMQLQCERLERAMRLLSPYCDRSVDPADGASIINQVAVGDVKEIEYGDTSSFSNQVGVAYEHVSKAACVVKKIAQEARTTFVSAERAAATVH